MTTNKKRRIGRKVFAILLTLCLVFSTTCTSVFATELTETPVAGDAVAQTESDSQPEAAEGTGSTPNTVPEATQPSNGETVNTPTSVNAGTDSSSKADVPKAAQAKASVKKEMPAVVKNFLNAVNKLAALGEMTEENAEEFNALGQAAMDAYEAVQDAGLEDYEGVEDALMVLMGIADSVTGGAETMYDTYDTHITLFPSGATPTGTKLKVGDCINGIWYVESISNSSVKFGATGQHNNSFLIPAPATIWTGVEHQYNTVCSGSAFFNTPSVGSNGHIIYSGGSATYTNLKSTSSGGSGSGGTGENPGSGNGGGDNTKPTSGVWNFTLYYDGNGGSQFATQYWSGTKYTKSGSLTTHPNTPARDGYTFSGWKSKSNGKVYSSGSEYKFDFNDISGFNGGSKSDTLVAQWERVSQNYSATVTYVANTNDNVTNMPNPNPQTLNWTAADEVLVGNYAFNVSTNVPQRDGYEFMGWAYDPGTSPDAGWLIKPGKQTNAVRNETSILYAIWKVKDNGNGISVTKTRTSINGNEDQTIAERGDEIEWKITVTNNSNVTKMVSLTEQLIGASLSKNEVTLAPGKSETVTATYTVKLADNGKLLTNTVVATTDKEREEASDKGTPVGKPTLDGKNGNFTISKTFEGLSEDLIPSNFALSYEVTYFIDGVKQNHSESGLVSLTKNGTSYTGTINPTVWNYAYWNKISSKEQEKYKTVIKLSESNASVSGYEHTFQPTYVADATVKGSTATFEIDGSTFEKTLSLKNGYTKKSVEKVTVTWVDEDGTTVLDGPKTFNKGEEEPAYEGQTPTKAADNDNTYEFKEWAKSEDGNGNVTYTATYTATPKEKVTVTWVDEDGTTVLDGPKTFNKDEEEPAYSGETPQKAEDADNTYTFSGWTKSTDKDGNVTYKATYTATPKEKVTVTWNDGYTDTPIKEETVAKDISEEDLQALYPEQPTRDGFDFVEWNVERDDDGNITITAIWQEQTVTPTPTPDPPTPVGPTPITPVGPAATPTAATPALAAAPAAAPAAALVPVADAAVPLANVDADDTRQVNDEDVPLAKGAENEWALLNLLLMIFTILVSVMLLIFYFIGRKEDKDDEYNERLQAASEDETEAKLKRKGLFRLLSIIPAVVAVIFFILTEDMRNPMVFTDKWTLWMAVFALVNVVLAVFAKKKHYDNDDTQKPDYGIA